MFSLTLGSRVHVNQAVERLSYTFLVSTQYPQDNNEALPSFAVAASSCNLVDGVVAPAAVSDGGANALSSKAVIGLTECVVALSTSGEPTR